MTNTVSHEEQSHTQANRIIWNDWLAQHTDSDHYKDREKFLATGSSLRSMEREEVGEVAGKSLLHLLCNLGSDTLSWARLGAHVTGVDFAANAIEQAQSLAQQENLAARFICADLYALLDQLDEQFDVVIATYGVLCWLPDLAGWANIVSRYVKPGGSFYLVDMHPTANFMQSTDEEQNSTYFQVVRPYFHSTTPGQQQVELGQDSTTQMTLSSWSYGLGEVISALVSAGLHLDYLHEHAKTFYQQFPALIQGDDGWWRWPRQEQEDAIENAMENTMPLLFSLRASK